MSSYKGLVIFMEDIIFKYLRLLGMMYVRVESND